MLPTSSPQPLLSPVCYLVSMGSSSKTACVLYISALKIIMQVEEKRMCVCRGGLTHYERKQQNSTQTSTYGHCDLVDTIVALLRFNPGAT